MPAILGTCLAAIMETGSHSLASSFHPFNLVSSLLKISRLYSIVRMKLFEN